MLVSIFNKEFYTEELSSFINQLEKIFLILVKFLIHQLFLKLRIKYSNYENVFS